MRGGPRGRTLCARDDDRRDPESGADDEPNSEDDAEVAPGSGASPAAGTFVVT